MSVFLTAVSLASRIVLSYNKYVLDKWINDKHYVTPQESIQYTNPLPSEAQLWVRDLEP